MRKWARPCGLLVTSDDFYNTLTVWSLPSDGDGDAVVGAGDGGGCGLARVCTLGGKGSPAPMRFDFFYSGIGVSYLAFTPPPPGSGTDTPHLLLVSDWGHDAVHIVDVVSRTHVGYVAAPRTIAGPCGVAASGAASLVAISTWKERFGDQPCG